MTDATEDRVYLVCWPVAFQGYVEPGSTIERCARCDTALWVAPSSADVIAQYDPELVCLGCLDDGEFTAMLAELPDEEARGGLLVMRAMQQARKPRG